MKIAATYENGQIFQHFGHTEQFKIYTVENDHITNMEVVSTDGSGHGALAEFLKKQGVGILVCGGIGGGARTALMDAGIAVFAGASGEADLQVGALLAGMLAPNPDVTCDHHDHGEGCSCGCHHDHHGHHHADEVFQNIGVETPRKFEEAAIRAALDELDDEKRFGSILRAKGILPLTDGKWLHFDYVPGESDVRYGSADYTGRLCVIGTQINEAALKELFGL